MPPTCLFYHQTTEQHKKTPCSPVDPFNNVKHVFLYRHVAATIRDNLEVVMCRKHLELVLVKYMWPHKPGEKDEDRKCVCHTTLEVHCCVQG